MSWKTFSLLALSLALFAVAPAGGAYAQNQGRVCMSNDTVGHLTGFKMSIFTLSDVPEATPESGVFPIGQTRCLDIPATINGRPVTSIYLKYNYNNRLVAWTNWMTCTGLRPPNAEYNFSIRMFSGGAECVPK